MTGPPPQPFLRDSFHRAPGRTSTLLGKLVDRMLLADSTVWVLVAFGWIFRLGQYAANRSLWLDEASLALNLTRRSYSELLHFLNNNQFAPIGFLYAERFFVELLGKNEYALRIVPLFCGLASVVLFAIVARRVLPREASILALATFVFADTLIYYSSEVKQYSTDVVVALVLYWMTLWLMERKNPSQFLTFAIVGASLLWFSHPSVLVLAAMGTSVIFHFVSRHEWKKASFTIFMAMMWLISFAFEYYFFLRRPASNAGLKKSFTAFFWSFPPHSVKELYAYVKFFLLIFYEDLGQPLFGLAAVFFLLGFAALWKQRSAGAWLTLPPIVVSVLLSFMSLYPFRGRLILFLMPMFAVLIGAGAGLVWSRVHIAWPVIGIVCLGALFFYPVFLSSYHLFRPRVKQELRQVLQAAEPRLQPGDTVYLHGSSWQAFDYYTKELGLFRSVPLSVVRWQKQDNIFEYQNQLDQFLGQKRVWFLFSHARETDGLQEREFFLAYLNKYARKEWEIEIASEIQPLYVETRDSASIHLFDLSGAVSRKTPLDP